MFHKHAAQFMCSIIGGTLLTIFVFVYSLFQSGPVTLIPLENIDGIPFPIVNNRVVITESFAHTDARIVGSRFAKNLELTVSFNPGNADWIGVAVRENSFWFSYSPVVLFDRVKDVSPNGNVLPQTIVKTISIPLTDKIQSADQSIDVLFLARNAKTSIDPAHDRSADTIEWTIATISAKQSMELPNYVQAKQFVKRFISKEKPF